MDANDALKLDATCVKARVRRIKAIVALVTKGDDQSETRSSQPPGEFDTDISKLEIMKKLGVSGVPNLTALRQEVEAARPLWLEAIRASNQRPTPPLLGEGPNMGPDFADALPEVQ